MYMVCLGMCMVFSWLSNVITFFLLIFICDGRLSTPSPPFPLIIPIMQISMQSLIIIKTAYIDEFLRCAKTFCIHAFNVCKHLSAHGKFVHYKVHLVQIFYTDICMRYRHCGFAPLKQKKKYRI